MSNLDDLCDEEQKEPLRPFTLDDLESCWGNEAALSYFLEMLNGEYSLDRAREDLSSLVGSKYDLRENITL